MERVLGALVGFTVLDYLKDVLMFAETVEQLLKTLNEVLSLLI